MAYRSTRCLNNQRIAYRIYFVMELIRSLSLFDYAFFIDFSNSLDTQHF